MLTPMGSSQTRQGLVDSTAARTYSLPVTALALIALSLALPPRADAATIEGIHNIQHVVVIMQENRSFDSYFGTYPGADGIPPGVCVPDPAKGGCVTPYHDPNDLNSGGPHGDTAAVADVD